MINNHGIRNAEITENKYLTTLGFTGLLRRQIQYRYVRFGQAGLELLLFMTFPHISSNICILEELFKRFPEHVA